MKQLKRSKRGLSGRPLPFDFRSLEVFLAIAEERGITAAAGMLGLTQPAVSQVLAQLEDGLGVRLVDRKVKPLALTTAGTVLRDRAILLLEDARSLVPLVREASATKLAIVRIGVIDSLFTALTLVFGVELRASTEQLSISSGLTASNRARLLARDIDIAIGADAMEDIDELERFPLVKEPYVLLLPASRRKCKRNDLRQLADDLPFIRYGERTQMGPHIELYLRRLGLKIPRSQTYDHSHGVIRMVAEGLGWSIITPLCILDGLAFLDKGFCAPLSAPGLYRELTLVTRRGEMGKIPRQTATLARQVLRDKCSPAIQKLMPWIGEQFQVA